MKRLFVENFRSNTTYQAILDLFQSMGVVDSVTLHTSPGGDSLGYAFVVMENDREATSAISAFNNKTWNGIPLIVTLADWIRPRVRGFSGGYCALAHRQR